MLNKHNWHQLKDDTQQRLSLLAPYIHNGKIIDAKDTVAALEAVIRSFDRVNIEGNNQKQADFFAECLCKLDPQKINGLHMVQSSVPLSTHLDLFEKGIAQKLDFAYAGPQDGRLAQLIQAGKIKLGAIHTYLELFSRYFVDLTPRVSLITAFEADKDSDPDTGLKT
ncbi:malonate decarboxylase subunit alpha, partial [Klebsiella quasivariicola]|uniref:malonate decarboxylase subunit alpha n=1 Tax=Klebsiella quasivariicola TaxID=2026240 RepID=UPI0020224B33